LLAQGSFNAQIYHAIGTKALQAEQFDKATRYLSTARQLDPQNPAVLNNLALATLRGPTPDPANSLQLAETVLELVPDNPDALSTRAEVLLAMERWQEADRDLQLALPSRPESRNVRRMLIRVNEQLGNDALAEEHRRILESLQ
jgi:predicted Zn-dependent protease